MDKVLSSEESDVGSIPILGTIRTHSNSPRNKGMFDYINNLIGDSQ